MRVFSTVLALATLSLASPLAASLDDDFLETTSLETRQALGHPPNCGQGGVHIIATGGDGNYSDQALGLLKSLVQEIQNTIPKSDTLYSVPYPRNSSDPAEAAMIGVTHLTKYLRYYVDGCPNTPIALLGYSLGAVVTMNTLCGRSHIGDPYTKGISVGYAKHIIATISYGDESRIPRQTYDLGTCTTGHGVDPRGKPAGCRDFKLNFESFCDLNDPFCCGGNDTQVHYSYPKKYNRVAVKFIKEQYKAYERQSW